MNGSMNVCMHEWIHAWMHKRNNELMHGLINECMDEWVNAWINELTNGWMNERRMHEWEDVTTTAKGLLRSLTTRRSISQAPVAETENELTSPFLCLKGLSKSLKGLLKAV